MIYLNDTTFHVIYTFTFFVSKPRVKFKSTIAHRAVKKIRVAVNFGKSGVCGMCERQKALAVLDKTQLNNHKSACNIRVCRILGAYSSEAFYLIKFLLP